MEQRSSIRLLWFIWCVLFTCLRIRTWGIFTGHLITLEQMIYMTKRFLRAFYNAWISYNAQRAWTQLICLVNLVVLSILFRVLHYIFIGLRICIRSLLFEKLISADILVILHSILIFLCKFVFFDKIINRLATLYVMIFSRWLKNKLIVKYFM